jgi:hypothetical protein
VGVVEALTHLKHVVQPVVSLGCVLQPLVLVGHELHVSHAQVVVDLDGLLEYVRVVEPLDLTSSDNVLAREVHQLGDLVNDVLLGWQGIADL